MPAEARVAPRDETPHVVIIGGGFAGLYAARALGRAPVRVTLVDRRNHHLFQPLLYQVATAALAAPDVAAPIRKVLRRQTNATVLLAEARAIDVERRRVVLADGELAYDQLIVATGSTHAYFGHDEWARFAPGLKGLEDALEIRRRLLVAFETAEREADPAARKPWLTFVVIGAGPTGVELAGAMREIAQRTLARDFRNFDPRETRVVLLDAAPRVLPSFPEELSASARALLERRGVEVRTGAAVTAIDAQGVTAGDARIEARTVVWAAGVQASSLARSLGAPLDKAGRVLVEPDLTVPGHPDVYVVGDLAAVRAGGGWVPGMAPGAIQEGRHAAANVLATIAGRPRRAFRYHDRGLLATIGRSAAVAEVFGLKLSGFLAWVVWLFVHVLWLIGFRNRVVVMFEWAWAYLTYQRSARVILERPVAGAADAPSSTSPGGAERSAAS
jgi:NADH dehydrogenase